MNAVLQQPHPSVRRPRAGSGLLLVAAALLMGGCAAQDVVAQAAPSVERSVKVHAGLYEVTTSTEDGTVWVSAVGSQLAPGARLVGLDPVTLEERRVIDLADDAAFGLAINNRTGTLYTSNTRAGTMSAVNVRTGQVTTIRGPDPEGLPHLFRVVVDEANNVVYASVAENPGKVWVVDGATNRLRTILEDIGARPTGLALDAAGNRLFVSNLGDNQVAVVDLASGRVTSRVDTGGERSTHLAWDPATQRLFVANQGTNDLSVLDMTRGTLVRKIPTGEQTLSVAFSPASNRLYVANRTGGTLTILDATTYARVADLEIGSFPNTVHLDAATGQVFVSNKAQGGGRGAPPVDDPRGDMVSRINP